MSTEERARQLVAAITHVAPERVETLAPEGYRLVLEALAAERERAREEAAQIAMEYADALAARGRLLLSEGFHNQQILDQQAGASGAAAAIRARKGEP